MRLAAKGADDAEDTDHDCDGNGKEQGVCEDVGGEFDEQDERSLEGSLFCGDDSEAIKRGEHDQSAVLIPMKDAIDFEGNGVDEAEDSSDNCRRADRVRSDVGQHGHIVRNWEREFETGTFRARKFVLSHLGAKYAPGWGT